MQPSDTPTGHVAVPSPANDSRRVSAMCALASPSLIGALKDVCEHLTDLSGMSPADVVAHHSKSLLLVEQGMPNYDQIVLALSEHSPNTALIIVSDHLPAHMVRALMKLEASDILPTSANLDDVVNAADRLSDARADKSGARQSVCWAFRGAVGGAGVTTLAIESAFDLARRVAPKRVCLVDLNVSDGMVMPFLEGVAKLDLAALSSAPERLDAHLLGAWDWEHEDGVSIIAAPRNPDADVLATEDAILRLLDVTCAVFDYVVVDMPRHMMPWTKAVLSAVDQAVIVSELTVPSLHAAADMCREADSYRGDAEPTKLVLNRMFPKKRFKAEFAVDQAERAIKRSINATITSDWDAARTAVNLGQPIHDVKPKSQLVKDASDLVTTLLPQGVMEGMRIDTKRRRRG